jgi:hypothetical protein
MSSNPVSGPLPCCGQLALVNECNRDFSTTARSEIYSPPQASLNRRVRLDVFGCCYCAFISGWTSTITGTQAGLFPNRAAACDSYFAGTARSSRRAPFLAT